MKDVTLSARVIGRSVRGASHVRADKTNQDAMAWQPASGAAESVVVAVADGHGSDKSFRSDRGSGMAVRIAIAVLGDLLPELRRPAAREAVLDRLAAAARAITERWTGDVHADLRRQPLSADELGALDARERRDLTANPLLAYGTTLLTAAITPAGVFFLQLGDGDIVFVARDRSAWLPLPEDSRNAGNQTLSLCLPDAARDFRLGVVDLDQAPSMILLSSDGFANSYQSEPAFLKFGSDLARMIDESGLATIENRLEGWLQETTEHGAGDDVTLAVVVLSLPPGAGRATAPAPPPAAASSSAARSGRAPTRRGRARVAAAATPTQRAPDRSRPGTTSSAPPAQASRPLPSAGPPRSTGSLPLTGPPPPAGPLRPSRRSRMLAVSMLGGAAVVLLLVLVISLMTGGEPDDDRPGAGTNQQAQPEAPDQNEDPGQVPPLPTAQDPAPKQPGDQQPADQQPGAQQPGGQQPGPQQPGGQPEAGRPQAPEPGQAPIVTDQQPARVAIPCGRAVCVLDGQGVLWIVEPGEGWQRSGSGSGWTRMTVQGRVIVLDNGADRREVLLPGNDQQEGGRR